MKKLLLFFCFVSFNTFVFANNNKIEKMFEKQDTKIIIEILNNDDSSCTIHASHEENGVIYTVSVTAPTCREAAGKATKILAELLGNE